MLNRPETAGSGQVDYRWLRAGRYVFTPAGVLFLLIIGHWIGALLWVGVSGAYLLVQPMVVRVLTANGVRRRVPLVLGLMGTTIMSIGPLIAASSGSPVGPSIGLIMLASGVQFLIAAYAAVPRTGLIVAIPCALATAFILADTWANPSQELMIVAMATLAALFFTTIHTRTALKDRRENSAAHTALVSEISAARDAALRAEQVAGNALERLQQSVAVVPAGLAFFGPDDRLTFWNDRLADYCGAYGVALEAGVPFTDLLTRMESRSSSRQGDRVGAERMNLRLAARATAGKVEMPRFDGRWFRYEYRRLPDGGASTTITDITEIKQRETFIQAIFNNNAVPMCVADLRTLRFLEANDALVALSGWSRVELKTMTLYDLVADSDRERFAAEHRKKVVNPAHSANRAWRFRTRAGADLFIRPYGSILTHTDGTPVLAGALLDVTAQMQAEKAVLANTRALRKAKRTAEAANQAKSDFLAMMSHELRTPLNGILGMAHALDTAALAPPQAEQVRTVVRSGQALTAILNDILDLSKVESGRMDLASEAVDIRSVVGDACEMWALVARDKGLDLRVDIAPTVPDWIAADPLRLRQIILNLLSNAIKFTERGHVALGLTPGATGTGLVLTITDTGAGLGAAAQKRLFRNFEQLNAGIARRHGGTGLGLAITRKLAQLMGGDITVASRLGKGTTFTVTLPLEAVAAPAADEPAAVDNLPTDLSILVAEDNPTNQAVIHALLGSVGWRLTVVDNGQKAIEAHRVEAFDLILMDVHMPVMDGLAAVRAIRAGGAGDPGTPIIALTADAMLGDRDQFLASGFDSHVPKPIEAGKLFQAILLAVNGQREPTPVEATPVAI